MLRQIYYLTVPLAILWLCLRVNNLTSEHARNGPSWAQGSSSGTVYWDATSGPIKHFDCPDSKPGDRQYNLIQPMAVLCWSNGEGKFTQYELKEQ